MQAAVLKASGCGMNDVVKTTVLLASMDDFATVNEIYAANFKQPLCVDIVSSFVPSP